MTTGVQTEVPGIPNPAAQTVEQQRRRLMVSAARALERKLATIRRQKLALRKLEEEARVLKREVDTWFRAEVPLVATELLAPATSSAPEGGGADDTPEALR